MCQSLHASSTEAQLEARKLLEHILLCKDKNTDRVLKIFHISRIDAYPLVLIERKVATIPTVLHGIGGKHIHRKQKNREK